MPSLTSGIPPYGQTSPQFYDLLLHSKRSFYLLLLSEMVNYIPTRSASAADVRRFITDVLVLDYDTDPEFASETARAWRIGRGAELHDASQEHFEHVFGAEIGSYLYRTVLDGRESQWWGSHIGTFFRWTLLLSPLLFFWTVSKTWSAPSNAPSFPLLLQGMLLPVFAYLRPKKSYMQLAIGLGSLAMYFAGLLLKSLWELLADLF